MPWTSSTRRIPYRTVAAGVLFALIVGVAPSAAAAEIDVTGPHTAEQAAVLRDAVASFEARIPRAAGCLGDVRIRFEDLAGRVGEYRVREGTVVLDVGRTLAASRYAFVHELMHQAMFRCGIVHDRTFKTAFYRAQGIAEGRGWFSTSGGWAQVPAEQLAEAGVALVLGGHDGSTPLNDDAIAVVRAWATGAPYPTPPAAVVPPAAVPAEEGSSAPASPSQVSSGQASSGPASSGPAPPVRVVPVPTPAAATTEGADRTVSGSAIEARVGSPSLSGPLGLHIGRIELARGPRPVVVAE